MTDHRTTGKAGESNSPEPTRHCRHLDLIVQSFCLSPRILYREVPRTCFLLDDFSESRAVSAPKTAWTTYGAMLVALAPSLLGWRPSLLGWRPSLVGWRPLLLRLEDISSRAASVFERLSGALGAREVKWTGRGQLPEANPRRSVWCK